MNRQEIVFTLLGLIATFALPWPGAGEAQTFGTQVAQVSEPRGSDSPAPERVLYGVFERVRTGPAAGTQPTR